MKNTYINKIRMEHGEDIGPSLDTSPSEYLWKKKCEASNSMTGGDELEP